MRREPANPFGTSMIDLLVGAMAIVALLWVRAAPNSGYRGTGEEERTSGMITIEQFGVPHIVGLHLEQRGRLVADFSIHFPDPDRRGSESIPAHMTRVPDFLDPTVTEALTLIDGSGADRFSKAQYQFTPPGEAEPVSITLQLIDPPGNFRKGVRIIVESLDARPLVAKLRIAPCCSRLDPHYLDITSYSAAGVRKETTLWHDYPNLQRLLGERYTRPTEGSERDAGWVASFARRILNDKETDVALRSFSNPGICEDSSAQAAAAGTLTVRFEPDGDIVTRKEDGNEAATAAASRPADYAFFAAGYLQLLRDFARTVP